VAMQRYVERGTPGALRDEFSNILNDMRLGKTRAEAIRDFGRRVGLQEVGSFVSVLVQADQLGVPIGEVLRSQAAVMRVQRFQRAEQEGARASQKLLVPLVFFIFPAVLIVILGPVILHFISASQ
jgi:tight adherence protein C